MKTNLLAFLFLLLTVCYSKAGSATWNLNPGSNDWDTATNWTPATIPNGVSDVATFDTSAVTDISITASSYKTLASIQFAPGADAYTISASGNAAGLQFAGDGIVNNSGKTQQFVATDHGLFDFYESASCGDMTNFTLLDTGMVFFEGQGSASTAHFTLTGGYVLFFDQSTAASATFDIGVNGEVDLAGASSPNAVFNVVGGTLAFQQEVNAGQSVVDCSEGGQVIFTNISPAPVGSPQVTAHGATSGGGSPARIYFRETSTADHSVLIVDGGTAAGARSAALVMQQASTLANANVIVNGGVSGAGGGRLVFQAKSDGGSATVTMSGNAVLDIRYRVSSFVGIGSLAGEGSVFLGSHQLRPGANNLDTTFSGVISEGPYQQGAGSLDKVGTGTLTLSGTNTYTGGTTVSSGGLIIANATGSGTGTGSVTVNAGTLGGKGIIAGAVAIGTGNGPGAFVAPAKNSDTPTTLTMQSTLTFASDGTYTCRLNTKKVKADQIIANGVTIMSGAQFVLDAVGNTKLPSGTVFTAINNTSASSISGTFANLADGVVLTVGRNKLQASYEGGDGNDLTLTVE